MAWLAEIPPTKRHPRGRFQVCYREDGKHRSAGIYASKAYALKILRAVERGSWEGLDDESDDRPRTPFGAYVTEKWWPAWRDQHPDSAYGTSKKIEKRILPTFGDIPLAELDATTIGQWKGDMVTEGLSPRTTNTYLSLLGTILNAAVDDEYLDRSPLLRRSGAGRAAAVRNQPVNRREVWLSRAQLDQLTAALPTRYRALVVTAAHTGLRWGELTALRWEDVRWDEPLNDGAISGPGRLRVRRAVSSGNARRVKGPKTAAGLRTVALNQETIETLRAHQELVGNGTFDPVFTSPGGSRGEGGVLTGNNFGRVWRRALKDANLDKGWPEFSGLRFHDLRHTHATWLIARRVPMVAVANRLGHANPVITMMVYAHVDRLVERGELTTRELGLTSR